MARDFDIKEQIGRHMHFDLVDFDRVNSFRAPKNMSINEVKVHRWSLLFDMIMIIDLVCVGVVSSELLPSS